MGKVILLAILKLIGVIISIIMIPFNALIESVIPDVSTLLTNFTTAINTYFSSNLAWFFYLLPPLTRSAILIMLTFTLTYYTATITVHFIVLIIDLAKRIREMFI